MRRREDDLVAWRHDPVVRALQAPASDDELAGVRQSMAWFRAVHAESRSRRRFAMRVGSGAVTVVAALGLTGGVAAAYPHALPAPVQSTMHVIFGPIVPPAPVVRAAAAKHVATVKPAHRHPSAVAPVAPHATAAPAVTPPPRPSMSPLPTPSASASETSAQATPTSSDSQIAAVPTLSTSASPTPSASDSSSAGAPAATVTASASRSRVQVQQTTTVQGEVTTDSGDPVAGEQVLLQQQLPGDTSWTGVGSGQTADDGTVSVRSPQLTSNVSLRLVTPDGIHSASIAVTVLPRVTTAVSLSRNHQRYVMTVTVTGAQTGDYISLSRYDLNHWTMLQHVHLPDGMQVTWSVPAPASGSVRYRIAVAATAQHGDTDVYVVVAPPS